MTSDQAERRIHPAGVAISAIKGASSAWFVGVAIVASAGVGVGLAMIALLLLATAALSFVGWRVTTYAVVDGGLRYRTGIFARREVDVPASRISALDTSRGILQRMFGVVALEVQTPGGGAKPEVVLEAVSLAEAERLRHALGHRAAGVSEGAPVDGHAAPPAPASGGSEAQVGAAPGRPAGEPPAGAASAPQFRAPGAVPVDAAEVVFRATPRDLLLAGVTSPSGALIGASVAALYGPLQDVLGAEAQDSLESGAESAVQAAPFVVAAILLVAVVLLSVLSTVLAFHGFEVTRDERRVRVRRGLLTERTGTLQLDRVHALRIVESPLRQLLGFASVEAEVAGWARQDDAITTIVPFVRRSQLPELLPRLVPGYAWPGGELERPPSRATRRYVTRALWLPGLVVVGLAVWAPGWWAVPLSAALLTAGAALGLWRARAAGWLVDGRLTVLRSRVFDRQTCLALTDRVQLREATSNPFQRRAQLATLRIRLSSRRRVHVAHLDKAVTRELVVRLRPATRAVPASTSPAAGP